MREEYEFRPRHAHDLRAGGLYTVTAGPFLVRVTLDRDIEEVVTGPYDVVGDADHKLAVAVPEWWVDAVEEDDDPHEIEWDAVPASDPVGDGPITVCIRQVGNG